MRILAIDYGDVRIGVAVSDFTGTISIPVTTIDVRNEDDVVAAILELAREKECEKIVVGLPVNMNGTKGPMAEKVETFTATLREKSGLVIEVWDERMSSLIAERVLLEADMSRGKRKKVRDKLAAQVILQGYLDAHA